VEPLNGREYFRAQEMQAETKVRMRLRYGSEIAAISQDWRATYDGKTYDILSIIQPSEINQEIILMCGEGVNDDGG
jgi:SPP1 family predicted phage head-tail adaptor